MKALSARSGGTDRLVGAVPILYKPGDIFIHNRLALHGAFPNTSPLPRATLIMGFHRRASVLGKSVPGGFVPGETKTYDAAYIDVRSRMIQLAIDARRQRFPEEKPYSYLPYRGREDEYRWSEEWRQDREFMNYPQKNIII